MPSTVLNSSTDVDVIFLSSRDHNEESDNHGLFQMFKFFRENLNQKNLYVSTEHSIYHNDDDVFSIAYLGGPEHPLSAQINTSFNKTITPSHWVQAWGEDYVSKAANVLIENLPPHKFIALSDKDDIHLMVLEKVIAHFNSRVLFISAVNNTWTGYCSYPDENNCDKFKTDTGCAAHCPAIANSPHINIAQVSNVYQQTKEFVERNRDAVYLNVGNSYSANEARSSSIFRNVEPFIIPLKNRDSEADFEKLWETKQTNRNQLLAHLAGAGTGRPVKFFMFWTAYYMDMERKGMDFFVTSLKILKHLLKDRFDEVCLIVCSHPDPEYMAIFKKMGLRCIHAGFCSHEKYDFFLSLSDVHCSTTISEAGPRTNYESAALGTPVISFDRSNALDFVTDENGALVETYDVKKFAEAIERFVRYDASERKNASLNMHTTYKTQMDTKQLALKWQKFFDECEKNE